MFFNNIDNVTTSQSGIPSSFTTKVCKSTLCSKWEQIFDDNPKEWIAFMPEHGGYVYTCYACRNMFLSLTSFQDHINRRAIVIKYNCSGCTHKILMFYNRCSFLLHVRQHFTLEEGKINLCELDIFLLPVSLAGFLPHPNVFQLYTEDGDYVPENAFINAQFYTPDVKQKGQQVIKLKPHDLVFKQSTDPSLALKQVCVSVPKCKFVSVEHQRNLRKRNVSSDANRNVVEQSAPVFKDLFESEDRINSNNKPNESIQLPIISKVESLNEKLFLLPRCLDCDTCQAGTMAEHYLGSNRPLDDDLKCSTCKFIAPTECSLKAHRRIHNKSAPFVCPDCGKSFPNWEGLQNHTEEVCFHMSKYVRFRCPGKKCGKIFALTNTFEAHFEVHLKSLFICSVCKLAFFKKEDTVHHEKTHGEECSFDKIWDCTLCNNTVPLCNDDLLEHIRFHTDDNKKRLYVYMCKSCRNYFRSTTTYATHLLKCGAIGKQSSLVGPAKRNVSLVPKVSESYSAKDCEKCSCKMFVRERSNVKLCAKCHIPPVGGSSSRSVKKYFCILCKTQIRLQEQSFHTKVCKYSKPSVMVSRIKLEDYPESCKNLSDFVGNSSISGKGKRARYCLDYVESVDVDIKKKRKKHAVPNFKLNRVVNGSETELIAEKPRNFDGTYLCILCEFKESDRSRFHEHIKSHRNISTAFQCMECGECFVVKPSLIKHLLHFHNILDYDAYLKKNDCYDVEAVKELEEVIKLGPSDGDGSPLKENQCRICRKEFDDSAALNIHFRIHGMAFLLKNTK